MILRNLSCGNRLRACTIAASSPEYGFCCALIPRVDENVSSFELRRNVASWMVPPIPTRPFRAKLLTAMYTAQFASIPSAAASSVTAYNCFSQGASINGLMVSSFSISKSFSTSAILYSGDRCCLWSLRIRAVLLRSGLVLGSVWISVYSLIARL